MKLLFINTVYQTVIIAVFSTIPWDGKCQSNNIHPEDQDGGSGSGCLSDSDPYFWIGAFTIDRGLVPDLVNQNLDPHPCRGVRLKIKKFMRWVSYQINYLNCVTYNGHPVDTAVWPNGWSAVILLSDFFPFSYIKQFVLLIGLAWFCTIYSLHAGYFWIQELSSTTFKEKISIFFGTNTLTALFLFAWLNFLRDFMFYGKNTINSLNKNWGDIPWKNKHNRIEVKLLKN